MTEDEKLEVIGNGAETRHIEYKEAYDWDIKEHRAKVARAMMALSNVPTGGYLVMGVRKDAVPVGIDPVLFAKITQDKVSRYVNNCADPYVNFNFFTHTDAEGRLFIILQVFEFLETPVVCNTNHEGVLQQGVVYTRPRRMVESVPVPSQNEMREIIELAVDKRMRADLRRIQALFQLAQPGAPALPVPSDDEKFDAELKGAINQQDVLDKIQSRGYWRTLIRPAVYPEKKIESHKELYEMLIRSVANYSQLTIQYPYFTPFTNLVNVGDGIVFWVDDESVGVIQLWKLYFSGQFVHYFSMREDWYFSKGKKPSGTWHKLPADAERFLAVDTIVQTLTWLFMFAANLYDELKLDSGMSSKVEMHKTDNRFLYFANPNRFMPFLYSSIEPTIGLEQAFSHQDLMTKNTKVPLNMAIRALNLFNWMAPPVQILEDDQKNYLDGKYS